MAELPLALYSKHRAPPNSSCNAIARGIVLGSTCVASESGTWGKKGFPVSRGVSLGRGRRGQGQRALDVPGGAPSPEQLRTGCSAQPGAEEPGVSGRFGWEWGGWVGAA